MISLLRCGMSAVQTDLTTNSYRCGGITVRDVIGKQKGSALATTIIIFLVVAIFGLIVITLSNQNLLESKRQESMTEAYYLAYSGIEMALSSLKMNNNAYFDQIKNNPDMSLVENDIAFGNGLIDIFVRQASQAAGDPLEYKGWVMISSTATLNTVIVSSNRTIYVDPDNQKNIVWR